MALDFLGSAVATSSPSSLSVSGLTGTNYGSLIVIANIRMSNSATFRMTINNQTGTAYHGTHKTIDFTNSTHTGYSNLSSTSLILSNTAVAGSTTQEHHLYANIFGTYQTSVGYQVHYSVNHTRYLSSSGHAGDTNIGWAFIDLNSSISSIEIVPSTGTIVDGSGLYVWGRDD